MLEDFNRLHTKRPKPLNDLKQNKYTIRQTIHGDIIRKQFISKKTRCKRTVMFGGR